MRIVVAMDEATSIDIDHIHAVLRKLGPSGFGSVANALAVENPGFSEQDLWDVLDAVETSTVIYLLDERLALRDALGQGLVLTHRVSAAELAGEFLAIDVDLLPLADYIDEDKNLLLADGTYATEVWPGDSTPTMVARGISSSDLPREGALLLPDGALNQCGVRAGDLVSVRHTPTGFEFTAVGPEVSLAAGRDFARMLADLVDHRTRSSEPLMLDQAFWTALANTHNLLTEPTLPISELFAEVGLVIDVDWLAREGFDFDAWRLSLRLDPVADSFELSQAETNVVLLMLRVVKKIELLLTVFEGHEPGVDVAELFLGAGPGSTLGAESGAQTTSLDEGRSVKEILGYFQDPVICESLFVVLRGGLEPPRALELFAESTEALAPEAARAGLRWLQGKAREMQSDVLAAESRFADALRLDSGFYPAAYDLARCANDRSDAIGGLEYLRRAGVEPDDDLAIMLEHFAGLGRVDLGSKQPCWCGSGRKYKRCHLGKEEVPLADRAGWLYQKAGHHATQGPRRLGILALAQVRAAYDDDPYALLEALDDPLIGDVMLFEGGAFREFLGERGALLPDDELLLAEQWLLIERSVFEVIDVSPGVEVALRDVRTGEQVVLSERTASQQLRVGDFICTRLLPVGDTPQIFGGVERVGMGERHQLIALLDGGAAPADLVGFLSRRLAPPVFRNTENEPMMMCEAVVRVYDTGAARKFLEQEYRNVGDDPSDSEWIEEVIVARIPRVRVHFDLDGDLLRIHANSEARLERALAAVTHGLPGATVVSESRTPASAVAAKPQQGSGLFPGGKPVSHSAAIAPTDPAIVEVLAQIMRQHETNWLDESIPALDGFTPRQAVEDPTRRGDVIRLLNSFPAATNSGEMDPDRLRAALGL